MTKQKDQTDKQEESIVLLPCPFCGGRPELYVSNDWGVHDVRCSQCHVTTRCFLEPGTSTATWNRRDGDACRHGCKIKQAVKEFSENLSGDYSDVPQGSPHAWDW